MRSAYIVAGFLVGLSASVLMWSVAANSADSSSSTIYEFTTGNVTAALTATGATNIASGSDEFGPYVDYNFDGLKYRAGLHLCKAGSCSGLELICSFNGVAVPLEALNKYNTERVIAKGIRTEEKRFRNLRYIIADGGVTRAHIQKEIEFHIKTSKFLVETLKEQQIIARAPALGTYSMGRGQAPQSAPSTHAQDYVRVSEPFANELR